LTRNSGPSGVPCGAAPRGKHSVRPTRRIPRRATCRFRGSLCKYGKP